ncbi:MAG: hypothetical protein ABSH56_30895 [Bryobacteraceae bacterium]|jgi:hypothetical protein
MRSRKLFLSPALLLAALLPPVIGAGCAVRVNSGYRVYDPYYHDYHVWDDRESASYHQWIAETHHEDRDYRKLNKGDQKQYWDWRHGHPDQH